MTDVDLEVAPGVFFPGWVYNGTAPGPVIRATEGDRLRVRFVNGGAHPHTINFHGIHPTNMDGVFEIVEPGGRFTYEFEARPYGLQLYHCHATPLKKHIHKGLYAALIIDPLKPTASLNLSSASRATDPAPAAGLLTSITDTRRKTCSTPC